MTYVISTDNLTPWECETLKEGAEAMGRYVAEEGKCEPSVIEVLDGQDNPLSVDVIRQFENDMLGWVKWREGDLKEGDLDFRRYGHG